MALCCVHKYTTTTKAIVSNMCNRCCNLSSANCSGSCFCFKLQLDLFFLKKTIGNWTFFVELRRDSWLIAWVSSAMHDILICRQSSVTYVFGWLAGHLIKSLFTFCQNSIFLSQQSIETVFFSPTEQALTWRHYIARIFSSMLNQLQEFMKNWISKPVF